MTKYLPHLEDLKFSDESVMVGGLITAAEDSNSVQKIY